MESQEINQPMIELGTTKFPQKRPTVGIARLTRIRTLEMGKKRSNFKYIEPVPFERDFESP